MGNAGGPFSLESFGVLGHSSFIKCSQASRGYFLNKFLNGVASEGSLIDWKQINPAILESNLLS